MLTEKKRKFLHEKYFNVNFPSSFGSLNRLYKSVRDRGITREETKRWLESTDTYTAHKRTTRPKPRRRFVAFGPNQNFQSDLAIVEALSEHNDGVRYLQCTVDIFSKRSAVEPMKTKTSKESLEAFLKTIKRLNRAPKNFFLFTDKGSEYMGAFHGFMKKNGIQHFYATNTKIKASIAENYIRTLKRNVAKYLYANSTLRYVDVLEKIVENLNNTYHRSIGKTPMQVTPDTEYDTFEKLYKGHSARQAKNKFAIGDYVRISKLKHIFEKEAGGSFTEEIFQIHKLVSTRPVTYKIRDLSGKDIVGSFYEQELVKIRKDPWTGTYTVEVLKKRKRGKTLQYFVHYKGWPKSFDEWLSADRLADLSGKT